MSGYSNYNNEWDDPQHPQQNVYSFDLSGADFGSHPQELAFQSFDHNQQQQQNYQQAQQPPQYTSNPYLDPSATSAPYTGEIFTPSMPAGHQAHGTTDFDDEPPLLEELGINPDHIVQKTLSVLNPFRATESSVLQDTDMAGPLVFCLAFGSFLLLSGKVHFSYIYGIGVLGCMAMYALLTLMTVDGTTLGAVVSVLGYCLLPMVGLSGINVLLSLQGFLGIVLTGLTIAWCSLSASKLFVSMLNMEHQLLLVAYPCALLYGVFALITIF
ncbi:protein YIPF5 [Neocloeon triangulifer]|uniref:protein YIPF5 n=1 Tax=Neocloeon triangulifer TaxID=2078957 RepID=UPI00286F5FC1|nr:protein YIPF5 [Neocloeon triangulifer]